MAEILNSGSAQPARNLTNNATTNNPAYAIGFSGVGEATSSGPGEAESLSLGPGIWLISVLAAYLPGSSSTDVPEIAISTASGSSTNAMPIVSESMDNNNGSTLLTVGVITLQATTTIYVNVVGPINDQIFTITTAIQIG